MRDKIEVLGMPMHPWTMSETVDEIQRRIDNGGFTQHVVVNVAKIVNAGENPALRDAVVNCDIINIDGMGVVWGARLLGEDVPERVAGIDLFHELLAMSARQGFRVFLLGAREDVLEQAVSNLREQYPQLQIAGYHHGYIDPADESIAAMISASKADLLFVGITSPKKEQFIDRWRDRLGVRFAMGVGGTFDVVSGKVQRAPQWMQKSGLEWFYRFAQEPRRMWRRYLVTNSRFAWMILNQRLRGQRNDGA